MDIKVLATNRKAKHEYFLLETQAGQLKGSEIKSVRAGQIGLAEAFVRLDGQEAWLMDAYCTYEQANRYNTSRADAGCCCWQQSGVYGIWYASVE
jgi:SsrA-binding protein